ncbi:hypothetical protein [Mucilaginibacter lappiensis]|uniref:Uncharacterized protein n=1 Tax=Mucilaginibacter lappiensis TaxID=354630 RepID=A0A1N6UHJ7_9SPHI|nr:hypothetical protein [Mucilaginibacter lappiensis]MBB6108856.1 hypothetical protein [Mucilaginibacter lappiensis]MBB6130449.1 hypothetical protein [Mucilaginibacter lappiensis]SIQ65148.1 hypothetical protein SAMN05421821_10390 [Mucilaginibacter lappiensis]
MNKYYWILETKAFKITLLLVLFALSIVYSIVYNKKKEAALKSSDFVSATIIDITPSRSCTRIYVEYVYNGVKLRSDFSVMQDSFKIREKILLKVAKRYPDEYFEFVRKIR